MIQQTLKIPMEGLTLPGGQKGTGIGGFGSRGGGEAEGTGIDMRKKLVSNLKFV